LPAAIAIGDSQVYIPSHQCHHTRDSNFITAMAGIRPLHICSDRKTCCEKTDENIKNDKKIEADNLFNMEQKYIN
jgi:hypothetical protein